MTNLGICYCGAYGGGVHTKSALCVDVPGPKQPPRMHGEGCICGDYTLSHCPVKDRKPPARELPPSNSLLANVRRWATQARIPYGESGQILNLCDEFERLTRELDRMTSLAGTALPQLHDAVQRATGEPDAVPEVWMSKSGTGTVSHVARSCGSPAIQTEYCIPLFMSAPPPAVDAYDVVRGLLALIDAVSPPDTIDPAISSALAYLRGDSSGSTKEVGP